MEAQPPKIEQHKTETKGLNNKRETKGLNTKTETKGLHTKRASEAEAAIHSLWARGGSSSLTTYPSHLVENPLACS